MEILQTLWLNITTSNLDLTNKIGAFMVIIEMFVAMKLFTTVLNMNASKMQKFSFIGSISILSILTKFFMSNLPYLQFLHFIITILVIMICFKSSFSKSLIAELLPMLVIALLEPFFVIIYTSIFNIGFDDISTIPIFRISLVLLIYLGIYIISLTLKKLNFSIMSFEHIDRKNKNLLMLNAIFGFIAIIAQLYLFKFYSENMPYLYTAISIVGLVLYFFFSIYSLTKTVQLQKAQEDLVESQLYNKSLKILHDNNRAFKHDFSNIVQAIGRLCWVR